MRAVQTIILTGFEVSASIGIHGHERAARQRLLLDVEIVVETGSRPAADSVDHVLDYDFIRDEIHRLLGERHYDLQETLCHDIADLCLTRAAVASVMIYSRKPDIYPDCESVGFRLAVSR